MLEQLAAIGKVDDFFEAVDSDDVRPATRALGPRVRDRWLLKLDGPASANKEVQLGGSAYVLAASCKPHDCGDNKILLLYSAGQKIVYGKLAQGATSRLLGAPPPAMAAEIERLWSAEWQSR